MGVAEGRSKKNIPRENRLHAFLGKLRASSLLARCHGSIQLDRKGKMVVDDLRTKNALPQESANLN